MRTQLPLQDWDPNKYLGKRTYLEIHCSKIFLLFSVKINDYNRQMPTNFYLLLGDPTLEMVKKEIDKIRYN